MNNFFIIQPPVYQMCQRIALLVTPELHDLYSSLAINKYTN
jgi:hypothetical protein